MHILKISLLSSMLLLDSFFGASTALNSAENETGGTYWFEVERSSGERSIAGIPGDTLRNRPLQLETEYLLLVSLS